MGFKEDLKSLKAAIYPFMKGRLKKKNRFTLCLKTNTFWKFPWGAGKNSRAGPVVGLELGNHEKASAD